MKSGSIGLMEDVGSASVDVVVPVYGAHEFFVRCVASVRRHTDLARHRLVVVLDGPGQEPARAAAEEAGALVLENDERRGFVVSANRGMAASPHDVVLLNSDTEVTAGWLDKLQAAAYSDAAIATVTPFSNNATLVLAARAPFEVNALPAGPRRRRFAPRGRVGRGARTRACRPGSASASTSSGAALDGGRGLRRGALRPGLRRGERLLHARRRRRLRARARRRDLHLPRGTAQLRRQSRARARAGRHARAPRRRIPATCPDRRAS